MPVGAAVWYLDSGAIGSHNGTSWTNAWTSITQISGVGAGDVVYISGGPAGQTRSYTTPTSAWNIASGTAANPIIYQIGQDSQHNGTAIFDGSGSSQGTWLYAGNCTGVTISGDAGDGKMHFALTNWTSIASANNATVLTMSYINFGYIPSGVDFNPGNGIQIDHCWCFINSTTADHFSYLNGNNSSANPWGRNKAFCNTIYIPHLYASSGGGRGADGFQWNSTSIDIYSNLVVGYSTNYTGGQHQDGIQTLGGSYYRIHDNVFLDIANYPLFGDGYYASFNYCQMYNNVACFSDSALAATAPPQAGGWGVDGGWSLGTVNMTNTIVCNNLAVDYGGHATWNFGYSTSNPYNYVNCYLANNISINGGGSSIVCPEVVNVDNAFSISSSMASNIFVRYVPFGGTNNDFHLNANATTLIGQGTNLSQFFNTDKSGNVRPASGAWDIGPYQYSSAISVGNTNPVVSISPSSLDFGLVLTNASANLTLTVQNTGAGTLTGSASVAAPFQIVSGGSYSLGSNQTQVVTIQFKPTAAGPFSQSVAFTGGGGASVGVSGVAYSLQSGLAFTASAGTVFTPFAAGNMSPVVLAGTTTTVSNYISQASTTGLSGSGEAVYGFNVTNAGNYVISALVNAPSDAANSFYVNIDAQPTDPVMIWDAPVTSGFTNVLVSWRGSGTDTNNQYVPAVFNLAAGVHQLIVRGREAGAQLAGIAIWPYTVPPAPTGLRIVSAP